jgi:spermidine synthase
MNNRLNILIKIYIAILFYATGFASLSYQVAWNKVLSQTVGSDFYSTTIIVSIFMLGLGLGGYIGGNFVKYLKTPIYVFFIAEIIISLFGFVSVDLLRSTPVLLQHILINTELYDGLAIDFIANLFILLLPTILMGSSLPIMANYYKNKITPGATVGFIYSVNIMGASIGAFVSGFYLIGTIGISSTVDIVSFINLCLSLFGLAIVLFVNRFRVVELMKGSGNLKRKLNRNYNNLTKPCLKGNKLLFTLSFFIGFIALAYEILYFRVFVYYLSANTYVFPVVLGNYLLLMMLGNYLAAQGLALKFKVKTMIYLAITGIVLTSPILFLVPDIISMLNMDTVQSVFDLQFRTFYGSLGFYYYLSISILLSAICMLPVVFISMFFPIIIEINSHNMADIGVNTGRVYLVQTYGNFVGALVTGFALFPVFGVVDLSKILVVTIFISSIFLLALNNQRERSGVA